MAATVVLRREEDRRRVRSTWRRPDHIYIGTMGLMQLHTGSIRALCYRCLMCYGLYGSTGSVLQVCEQNVPQTWNSLQKRLARKPSLVLDDCYRARQVAKGTGCVRVTQTQIIVPDLMRHGQAHLIQAFSFENTR